MTKKEILMQQIHEMSSKSVVADTVYSPAMIVREFMYFATLRALYRRICKDFQLPSVSTLTRFTSAVSKIDDEEFVFCVFAQLDDEQKLTLILHDEIYVKKMQLYSGGGLFGKSVDNPSELARTLLGIQVISLKGGPDFLSKMVPFSKLTAKLVHDQVLNTKSAIESSNGAVAAIICDGNRTNQAFMKLFTVQNKDKPWLTIDGTFLIFDFVHLIKCLRNLWYTEKCGELQYNDDGIIRIAKWNHLAMLFELEKESLVSLSELNQVAIAPRPIERQKVGLALRVFSEKTAVALKIHPDITESTEDTVIFIRKVVKLWKILNVRSKGEDKRFNDPYRAAITDVNDERLNFIEEFGKNGFGHGWKTGCKKTTAV